MVLQTTFIKHDYVRVRLYIRIVLCCWWIIASLFKLLESENVAKLIYNMN